MHSAIESRLIERLGDVGRKIHTGRSRNDQVLVALRLYLRDALATLHGACTAIAEVALARARSDADVAMPGYRSEEHTSELQSLMRISYAVFCLKKKKTY